MSRNQREKDEYWQAFRRTITLTLNIESPHVVHGAGYVCCCATNHSEEPYRLDHFYRPELWQPTHFQVIDEEGIPVPLDTGPGFTAIYRPESRLVMDLWPGDSYCFYFACVANADCLRIGPGLNLAWNKYPVHPDKRYFLTYRLIGTNSQPLDLQPFLSSALPS